MFNRGHHVIMELELCIMNWMLPDPQSHKVYTVITPLTNGSDIHKIGLEIRSDIYEYLKVQECHMRNRLKCP